MFNNAPIDLNLVNLNPGIPPHSGIAMNFDGTIYVDPGVPAGTYLYPYSICEILNPTNCAPAVATIHISAAVIEAINDNFTPINGYDGGTTVSVLVNDSLNSQPINPLDVTLTPSASPLPGSITMNSDGTVTVSSNTPAGIYAYPYQICEVINPSNCSTAVATITVANLLPVAVNDNYSAGNNGDPVVGDVSLNDIFGDGLNDFTIFTNPTHGIVNLNSDGTFTYTPIGVYSGNDTFEYRICDANGDCDSAIVYISDILPVNIVSFTGKDGGDCNIVLEWITANEEKFNGFEIQAGTDGRNFETIEFVKAKGQDSRYVFTFSNPSQGLNFFRLKLVEINESYTMSNIVVVNSECEGRNVVVYPTIATSKITVSGLHTSERVLLYDANGRLMEERKAASSTELFNISSYAQATYNVVVITEEGRKLNFKIIKQ